MQQAKQAFDELMTYIEGFHLSPRSGGPVCFGMYVELKALVDAVRKAIEAE